ncbi:MAG: 16S rRNA (uracil(1498)-N(3))-methyltransferase [Firmicutes bacterium]|nr:16S rRNA (uracil(1498)-N(3))-methyltransferase [Bacillota bacterium]
MHRFFLPSIPPGPEEFPLDSGAARKICRVLRLGPGDEIFLWDEKGKEYRARITKAAGRRVYVKVLEEKEPAGEPPLRIALVQGIPKGDKIEFIIQKATELGVWSIHPVVTERTVVQIPPERRAARLKRWQAIAAEAARQCGRASIPVVGEIAPFEGLREALEPGARKLIFWEGEGYGLKEYLRSTAPSSPVYLFIGPEGGFSPREVEAVLAGGGVSVSLGPRVLRTETAGLIGLSLILYEWGDLGGG